MKKKEIDEKYNHDELPKVKNWFLYFSFYTKF